MVAPMEICGGGIVVVNRGMVGLSAGEVEGGSGVGEGKAWVAVGSGWVGVCIGEIRTWVAPSIILHDRTAPRITHTIKINMVIFFSSSLLHFIYPLEFYQKNLGDFHIVDNQSILIVLLLGAGAEIVRS